MSAKEAEIKGRVLVVDDDEGHAESLSEALEMDGWRCTLANSAEAGIERLTESSFEAVLTDLVMPGQTGIDVLRAAGRLQPDCAVLLVTGHESVKTAVDALRHGAADYLSKPVDLAELRARLSRAVESTRLRRVNTELLQRLDERYGVEGLVGRSPQMQKVFDVLRQVAPSTATVLVLGESGTGKELVARAIHTNSPRAKKNFVAVNCAALAEGLIESELFGHVKGAFTGAVASKEGRMVYADGGTLFLDEVGDMPLATQAKLLRALETREVIPVGGNAAQKIDIRLVSATNRNLEEMVKDGRFREDLLYRLRVVELRLPPLRERKGDLTLLLDHFVQEFAKLHGRAVRAIQPEARAVLNRYEWPGNVRELRNVAENMVLLARGDVIGVEDLPDSVRGGGQAPSAGVELAGRSLVDMERELIRVNLELCGKNRERTAKILGIGERTLYRKIKEYGLE